MRLNTICKTVIGAVSVGLIALSATAASAQSYTIDPGHTYPSFKVPHLGISWWTGKFTKTAGSVMYDKAGNSGSVDIKIDAASIEFGHEKMNKHVRSPDFFNVEQHPNITYKGKMVFAGDKPVALDGEMTLLGTTKPLKLTIETFKCIIHPMLKKEVCGAEVTGEFDRNDFGMTKYASNGGGASKLSIQVEAVKN